MQLSDREISGDEDFGYKKAFMEIHKKLRTKDKKPKLLIVSR